MPADERNTLQEVTVTATRRSVSAQDLPISITAVSGASLDAAGIEDIAALSHSMSGVNFTDKGPFNGVAGADLIIRGLNSETTSGGPAAASPVPPPVATYVDDTPLFVNLRLQDLDHVEVLRGPQGTLYGSGSLGGTIRFVQNAPDPDGFDAKVEAGLSDTAHTHVPNEDINGMLNLPITSTFAIRLNAGLTDDAGFINMPNLYALDASGVPTSAQPGNLFGDPVIIDKKGVNSYQYRTGRLAALWKPSDVLKVQFSYYYQTGSAAGYPYIATNLTGYNQPINPANLPTGTYTNPPALTQLYNLPLPSGIDQLSSPENYADTTRDLVNLAALSVEYDMGFATLTSASSWARHNNSTLGDETAEYENFPNFPQDLYGQNPRMLVVGSEGLLDKPWSQEIRLASKSGGFLEWVGGVFFKHQTQVIQEDDYYPGYNAFYAARTSSERSLRQPVLTMKPVGKTSTSWEKRCQLKNASPGSASPVGRTVLAATTRAKRSGWALTKRRPTSPPQSWQTNVMSRRSSWPNTLVHPVDVARVGVVVRSAGLSERPKPTRSGATPETGRREHGDHLAVEEGPRGLAVHEQDTGASGLPSRR